MAMPLNINNTNVKSMSSVILDAVDKVSHAFDLSHDITVPNAVSPHLVGKALKQFLDILNQAELSEQLKGRFVTYPPDIKAQSEHRALSQEEISDVGNQGLQLLDTLSEWAQVLDLPSQSHQINAIMVMLALWIARHGGKLSSIESVVNTMAEIANATTDPGVLTELSDMMGELINAVSIEMMFDFKNVDHQHPWKILNINRGIIATRSHDTGLMEIVFDELIRNVPEDAEQFFEQGMQQMEALDYPDHVRRVMTRYLEQSKSRLLH